MGQICGKDKCCGINNNEQFGNIEHFQILLSEENDRKYRTEEIEKRIIRLQLYQKNERTVVTDLRSKTSTYSIDEQEEDSQQFVIQASLNDRKSNIQAQYTFENELKECLINIFVKKLQGQLNPATVVIIEKPQHNQKLNIKKVFYRVTKAIILADSQLAMTFSKKQENISDMEKPKEKELKTKILAYWKTLSQQQSRRIAQRALYNNSMVSD